MQALIAEARSQLPSVRKRFLDGLPSGQHLTVTTVLRAGATAEQVFVSVKRWDSPDVIDGLLATQAVLPGFRPGDVLKVSTSDVLDWTISRADGSEEGNVLGKYLDTIQ